MKKSLFIFCLLFSVALFSKAQDYTTGIGLRTGCGTGVSVKHFFNEKGAVEGILDTRWRGLCATGLLEIHNEAFDTKGLYWYCGGGAHFGVWSNYRRWDNDKTYAIFGLDGVVGLEYNIPSIPFNIGIDWKPVLNLTGSSGFYVDGGGIFIRYTF